MYDAFLTRSVESELVVSGDGRTVTGMLAPYNEIARVDDGFGPYWETYDPGCFERCLKGRAQYLRVQLEHNGHWVGRGELWRDGPRGLSADLRLDATEAGREAAYKIRDGQTPGLSLAFRPGTSRTVRHNDGRDVVHRRRIKEIHHVALCQEPAYKGAEVASIRSAPVDLRPERLEYWREWTERIRRD